MVLALLLLSAQNAPVQGRSLCARRDPFPFWLRRWLFASAKDLACFGWSLPSSGTLVWTLRRLLRCRLPASAKELPCFGYLLAYAFVWAFSSSKPRS